jgi:predicted RNA-binding Zn ribbon-like protein
MKKALLKREEMHWYRVRGKQPCLWDVNPEELVECANKAWRGEATETTAETLVYGNLRKWLNRFVDEGLTEGFLDDLNRVLHKTRYAKYILPQRLDTKNIGRPHTQFIAEISANPNPQVIAADDFSKLLTSGALDYLKRCHLKECGNLFLGTTNKKWCSKSCGSKYRVREKRQKDRL